MKRFLPLLGAVAFLTACASLYAADGAPSTILDTPIKDIQINAVTAYAVIRVLGQAYAALKSGGGLRGIWNALIYGANAPVQVMQSYREELGLKPVAVTLADGSKGFTQTAQVVVTPHEDPTAQKSPPS